MSDISAKELDLSLAARAEEFILATAAVMLSTPIEEKGDLPGSTGWAMSLEDKGLGLLELVCGQRSNEELGAEPRRGLGRVKFCTAVWDSVLCLGARCA